MSIKICLILLAKAIFIVIAVNTDTLELFKWTPTFCHRITEFCGYGESHLACNKNNWHVRCLKPYTHLFELPEDSRASISDKMNDLREKVASGKLKDYKKKAKRMGSVIWDDELGYLAELHCNSCEFIYDACFNTPNFTSAGRLTYATVYSQKLYNDENIVDLMLAAFDEWFSTHKYSAQFDMKETKGLIFQRSAWRAEKFATLMMEGNTRVGCAALYYKINNWHRYFVTCMFATKCINFKPVFSYASADAGSGCKASVSATHPSLCQDTEQYNHKYIDNYYT